LRALGSSIATAWLRAGSAIGPVVVGFMLTRFELGTLFLMFALVSVMGGLTAVLFAVETRERILEEVSP
jgi:putative MFS transporter